MTPAIKNKLLIGIPIILLVFLRIPSLFESYWYGDEAIYAAVSDGMHSGKLLYKEIWDHKPPLIFWVFYPGAALGWSMGFPLLRAFNIILGVVTLFAMHRILFTQKITQWVHLMVLLFLSFFLGSTLLEGNVLNAEVIFIAFNMLALMLLFEKRLYIVVGLLAFLSLVTKVPGFVEFGVFTTVIFIIYLKENEFKEIPKRVILMGIGFFVPMIVMLGGFYLRGTFPDFIYANATFNSIYSLHQGNFTEVLAREFPNTYLTAASLGLVLIFSTLLFWFKNLKPFSYIAITLFAGEFFASLLSAKNYGHYFLQVLPGIALLMVVLLSAEFQTIKLKTLTLWSILLISFMPMLFVLRSGGEIPVYAKPQEYYPWFISGYVFGNEEAKDRFWWSTGEGVRKSKALAEYVDSQYAGADSVYLYTDKPWALALTDRYLTNKYVVWFHLEYRDVHLNEELVRMSSSEMIVIDRDPPLLGGVAELLYSEYELIENYETFQFYAKVN